MRSHGKCSHSWSNAIIILIYSLIAHRSSGGHFLVSSRFMRDFYGAIKGTAFAVLTLDLGFQALEHAWAGWIHSFAVGISWATIIVTIVRGIPVIAEEVSFLKKPSATDF